MVIVTRARVREGDPKVERQALRRIYLHNDGETICTTPEETGNEGIDNEGDEDGMEVEQDRQCSALGRAHQHQQSCRSRKLREKLPGPTTGSTGKVGGHHQTKREDWINGCGADSRRLVQRLGAIHWCRQERATKRGSNKLCTVHT